MTNNLREADGRGEEPHNSVDPFQAWYQTNAIGDLVMHERGAENQKEPGVTVPWFDALPRSPEDVERDVVAVRGRLDYPQQGSRFGYVAAVEALDRLATLAHKKRRCC